MARSIERHYILTLDDLPKIIQADGVIYPIYLSTRDAARLFHVDHVTLVKWMTEGAVPVLKVGGQNYIEVAALSDWIEQHLMTRQDLRQLWSSRSERSTVDTPSTTSTT